MCIFVKHAGIYIPTLKYVWVEELRRIYKITVGVPIDVYRLTFNRGYESPLLVLRKKCLPPLFCFLLWLQQEQSNPNAIPTFAMESLSRSKAVFKQVKAKHRGDEKQTEV